VGRAFGKKIKKDGGRVFVLTGDGEMAEGSIWEALLIAKKLKLDNLILLVDSNKYGACYSTKEMVNFDEKSLKLKLEAFDFKAIILNGHDEEDLKKIKKITPGLNAIILNTIKGKGLYFLEESHLHGFNFFYEPEKYVEAMKLLRGSEENVGKN
jgi:transketolase